MSRREQLRLLLLVASFGLVIILINQLRRPEVAARLNKLLSEGQSAAADAPRPLAASPSDPQPSAAVLPDVSPTALEAIRDNAPFRQAETEAWFALLAALSRASPQQLASSPAPEVGYAQLVQQPHAYRARIVTVRGTARRVTSESPAVNELGIESYYRLVIQPRGDQPWPIFVYCLDLPADFPRGESVAADVEVVGFFFKNLSYQSPDGLGTAPVLLAKTVAAAGAPAVMPPVAAARGMPAAESPADIGPSRNSPPGQHFRELMALADWGPDRFARFVDDAPTTDDEQRQLAELLFRLKSFDAANFTAWAQQGVTAEALAADPVRFRGELIRLTGRVTRATPRELPPDDAARLEMPAFFECEFELDGGAGSAIVLATHVPRAWQRPDPLDEPAAVQGVFVKRLPRGSADRPAVLLAAKRIAWHPTRVSEPAVSHGAALLGAAGMDIGLLDEVVNHQTIRAQEREAFFQMLDAVGQMDVRQLIRSAQENISAVRQAWAGELEAADLQRRRLAQSVVELADDGRYSVAPLFLAADSQVGRLVAFDGMARRAARIEVGVSPEGEPSDIVRRFGIDHYYELELFTDDSQNLPVVFCARELPLGFPTGNDIRQPVRVAGFFFKSWRYQPLGAGASAEAAAGQAAQPPLIAPLLIGPAPLPLPVEQGRAAVVSWIGGGLFLLALAGIWVVAWSYARGDRKSRLSTAAGRYSLPPGQSLDVLDVSAASASITESDQARPDAGRSP